MAPFSALSSFRHFWASFQDTVACAQNVSTAAAAVGLGSASVGTVMEYMTLLKRDFRLPKGVLPVVLLCLGYPRVRTLPRAKLGTATVVHHDRYRMPSDDQLVAAFADKYAGARADIDEKRLKRIYQACLKAHGPKFARQCVAQIQQQGYIGPAQRYFGLHYPADSMPLNNLRFLRRIKRIGFGAFEAFRPDKRRTA